MSVSRLTIVRHGTAMPPPAEGETVISTEELKRWLRTGRVLRRLFGWQEVRRWTQRLDRVREHGLYVTEKPAGK